MAKYLLSVYQPEGTPPAPAELERIMADVAVFEDDAKAAGVWVFSGGLQGRRPRPSSGPRGTRCS